MKPQRRGSPVSQDKEESVFAMSVRPVEEKSMGKGNPVSQKEWFLLELPLMEYKEAWELQCRLVDAKREGFVDRNILMVLEHPAVITLGRQGNREHLFVSETFLQSKGISLFHVERGGDITYHGPGQVVCYPIVNMLRPRWRVLDFVEALEEAMIRTAGDWGVKAVRRSINRGVWVGDRKLGSIGIAIRGGVSFHGLALNVNTSLEPFSWIDPCGLEGVLMVSLEAILGKKIPMKAVRQAIITHMQHLFHATFQTVRPKEIRDLLRSFEENRGKELSHG
jgi:lipoate-protein ligase B